ncbi:MAG: monovalent cation/H+ antiporter complex subunit F [Armatimonadota bacterium]|nr:monovalent cation/H+ antiporter complex subunit F [Armatimonadota bacterium]MDW8156495.1 monovalent cation/H+ antiporter complex subunit F [Armatimonadota bacterium]
MILLALAVLACAGALCAVRVAAGPGFVDRVVAADALAMVLLNVVLTVGVLWDTRDYLEVALVLAALAFVGTVAAARFLSRGGPLA